MLLQINRELDDRCVSKRKYTIKTKYSNKATQLEIWRNWRKTRAVYVFEKNICEFGRVLQATQWKSKTNFKFYRGPYLNHFYFYRYYLTPAIWIMIQPMDSWNLKLRDAKLPERNILLSVDSSVARMVNAKIYNRSSNDSMKSECWYSRKLKRKKQECRLRRRQESLTKIRNSWDAQFRFQDRKRCKRLVPHPNISRQQALRLSYNLYEQNG